MESERSRRAGERPLSGLAEADAVDVVHAGLDAVAFAFDAGERFDQHPDEEIRTGLMSLVSPSEMTAHVRKRAMSSVSGE